ncbi:MAG: thioredoxin domain-containing protein [Candidatus Nanoarchaeia archaeon]|nr:thioredoxin domain-containing protein [Candidatus Nanoarchaeia archaeon]
MVEKEQHKTENKGIKEKLKLLKEWKVISIILAVLLIVSIFTSGFRINFTGKDKIGSNVVDYLNNYVLAGQGIEANFSEVTEESGLYNIKLNVGGKDFNAYVSKNGKYLFPSVIDLSVKPDTTGQTQTATEIPKTDKPEVRLFIMSYCPYGIQAMQTMAPVAKLIKNLVKVDYVIYSEYQGGSADFCIENGKYCSMHGIQELNEDARQLCIQKYQSEKFWDYYSAVSTKCTYQNVDSCWEAVAKTISVDTQKVKDCIAKEKVSLIKAEYDLDQTYQVSGSPTLMINKVQYSGSRTSAGYQEAICSAYNIPPNGCDQTVTATTSTTPAAGNCG